MDYLDRLVNGIKFIEENLTKEIDLHSISSEAFLSGFHFHRIFTALMGETPGDYIRSRRLSEASILLSESDKRILEIAIEYGYESQEAFTRAFKKQFRETPNRFRKKGYSSHFLRKEAVTREALEHLINSVTLEPQIIQKEDFTLCGVEGKTSKNKNRIGSIWQKIFWKLKLIPNQNEKGVMYGVSEYMDPAEFTNDTEFHYFAGVKVDKGTEPPKGLVIKNISSKKWAVFTHKGGLKTLQTTYNYIYGPWTLKTNEVIMESDDMEYYDSRFNPKKQDTSEIDIFVPIK